MENDYKDLKVVIIGCGSIGRRHARNLRAIGVNDLVFFDTDIASAQSVAKDAGGKPCKDFKEVLDKKPSIAFITTPTSFHIDIALKVAQKGIDLFIEKPLSHNFDGINELIDLVNHKNLITMIGCNMRFHPGPSKVKTLIEEGVLGKIIFAHIYTGSYLPEWRPWQDYRESYSANPKLGGGCILDCIHEIDLAYWYIGDIKEVICMADKISSLEIDVEDVAAIICRHNKGEISEIHLDYVQRNYERGCQIVGETGAVFWNFREKKVRWYNADEKQWIIFDQPDGWETNQMYIDEAKYFLDCVKHRRETMLPASEGAKVLQIALAAKKSSVEGRKISPEGFLN